MGEYDDFYQATDINHNEGEFIEKRWKVVISIFVIAVLITTGSIVYLNNSFNSDKGFFSLTETEAVEGFYTIGGATQYGRHGFWQGRYATTDIQTGRFFLTKKQKIDVNNWISEQKVEERDNLYDKLPRYFSGVGIALAGVDKYINIKEIRYQDDENYIKTDYIFQLSPTEIYSLTWEQYNEFNILCKNIDVTNEKRQTDIMKWQSVKPKTAILEIHDAAGVQRAILNKAQIEEIQNFFSSIDALLTAGSFCETLTPAAGGGGGKASIILINGVDHFGITSDSGEFGNAIYIWGADGAEAVYVVDDNTYEAYMRLENALRQTI